MKAAQRASAAWSAISPESLLGGDGISADLRISAIAFESADTRGELYRACHAHTAAIRRRGIERYHDKGKSLTGTLVAIIYNPPAMPVVSALKNILDLVVSPQKTTTPNYRKSFRKSR